MSIVINTKMPINCKECHSMGIRNLNDCQLIFSGCANCGRHPNCPLVDIEDIKAEIERESDYKPYEMYDMKWAFNKALSIIDKAVKECTHENN